MSAVRWVVLVGVGLFVACAGEPHVSWRIEIDDASLAAEVASIRADILRGTCAEPGAGVFHNVYARADATRPGVPDIRRGRYAFRATALDTSCRAVASSCVDVEIGKTRDVVSVLARMDPVPQCDECDAGVCVETDAGMPPVAASAVPVPEPVWPPLAEPTCSVRAPTFVWRTVVPEEGTVSRYELWLGPACDGTFPDCAPPASATATFPPEPDVVRWISDPLDAGQRYYWRVRACTDADCSDWSAARYLDVGRCDLDYDGDGFEEVTVGDSRASGARIHVFDGNGWSSPVTLDVRASETVSLAGAGDVNADGYSDLVAGWPGANAAAIYFGGEGGIDPTRSLELALPDGVGATFGAEVAGAGDFDGDGFSDVAVGAPGVSPPSRVFVFLGGAAMDGAADVTLVDEVGAIGLGAALAGCDVDGDGLGDVIAGAPSRGPSGQVQVFHGRLDPPEQLHALDLIALGGEARDGERFGAALACGDVVPGADGRPDGYEDVLVGAPDAGSGRVVVFGAGVLADGRRRFAPEPRVLIDGSQGGSRFGASLALIDQDGDGELDLAVGAPELEDGGMTSRKVGAIYWYAQSAGAFTGVGRSSTTDMLRRLGTSVAPIRGGAGPRVAGGEPADGGSGAGRVRIYRFNGANEQNLSCPGSTQPGCGASLAH